VLINELDGVYQSELLRGLRRAARELDVHLLCFPGSGLATESEYWRELNIALHMAGRVQLDGIVSFNGTFTWSASHEETLRFFARFGDTPIVSLGNPIEGMPQIRPDNRSGMAALVDHFIGYHGFRRIAFIAGPEHNSDARERLAVFRERCAAAGVAIDESWILRGEFFQLEARRAVERMLDRGEVPEAIIATNDEMAIAALAALIERGLRVPEDVAICGFDDFATVLHDSPPLSSVRQDVAGQSELALRQLVAHLREGAPIPAETSVPTRAIVRHSCGCSGSSSGLPHALLWSEPPQAEMELSALRDALREEIAGTPGAFRKVLSTAAQRVTSPRLDDLRNGLQILHREFAVLPEFAQAAPLLMEGLVWLTGRERIGLAPEVLERVFPSWLLSDILQSRLPSSEFSLRGTLRFLREGLLALGVRNAYLALFTRPGHVRRWDDCDLPDEAQLVLAIRDGVAVPTADYERFETPALLPFPVFHQDGHAVYSLLPIFQQSEHYGYLILDIGTRYSVRLEQLREAIANLVTSTFVVGELDRARELLRRDLDSAQESKAQLAQLAELDELTGLLNRRGFLARAKAIRRDDRAILLLVTADLDELKTINDTWGHAAGDEALCAFAGVLRASFRADDLIARFGGDEFVVLTQSFGSDTETQVRERLARQMALFNERSGRAWTLAASLGIVLVEAAEAAFEVTMQEADRRLYEDKRQRKRARS
jgi:diguanylate cyclase (GGDEF)-like protein